MKISVAAIIRGHWRTLYDAKSGKVSRFDIFVFYIFPVSLSGTAAYFDFHLGADFYSISITFFGIFVALLLNIQVAIFSIFLRKWHVPKDERQAALQAERLKGRHRLLSELNTNISYLTLIGAVSLSFFIFFLVFDLFYGFAPSLAVALYVHFILTFMMVLKRSYSLFQKEYEGNFS